MWTYYHFMTPRRISTSADLGAVIRDLRKARALTQSQLAEQADVSREWLIGVEQGKRPRAELSKVLAVLAALDVDLFAHTYASSDETISRDTPSRSEESPTLEATRVAIEHVRANTMAEPRSSPSPAPSPILVEYMRRNASDEDDQ